MRVHGGHVSALALFVVAFLAAPALHAQTTTVTFDDPPPMSGDDYLNGTFGGIDFGNRQWRSTPPYASDPTRSIYFASSTGTERSFRFVGGPRVLTSLSVYTTASGTLTLLDGVNPLLTRTVNPGALVPIATGWSAAANTVTIRFTAGWALGVDDLAYRSSGTPPPASAPAPPADSLPPTVSMTSPANGATVSGLINLGAGASDDVGVAGVQFLVDGLAHGPEDTAPPYAASWNTAATNNGPHTLAARARDAAGNTTTTAPITVTASNSVPMPSGHSLRFYGNGRNDIDRVKIRIDDPATTAAGPPVDVGATDFTIEFWLRGLRTDNRAAAISCGQNYRWIDGNIVFDRDRYEQGRNFGISLGAGRIVFGVTGSTPRTICGSTDVLDGQWHHVAVQRRRSDGWLWLYVDGVVEAQADGPDGDMSYPDDGVPRSYCGPSSNQPCTNSDPFIVIGAEKHDAVAPNTGFNGYFDELRISRALRYGGSFARPGAPFATDAQTVGLYHFDEGTGSNANDTSGAAGGPSDGVLRSGGSPAGPVWTTQSPFTSN